ncbi:MAG: TRAP transporter substrate-binding protein DctP [Hyphomicrobiaceae bacterium]
MKGKSVNTIRFTRTILVSAAATLLAAGGAQAETKYKLSISLETSPNHIRNIGVGEWAEYLEKKSGGKLEVKIYPSASKFKDTDVPKALNQGAIDMGMQGTWQLGKYESDVDAADLPIFYGITQETVYKVWDNAPGKFVEKEIEKKLGVKVIGRWLDLGFNNTYSVSKPIKVNTDMAGMKLRIPGGAGFIARYDALGAHPIKIAWPDVPEALQRGTVDGLATTFESMRSAKLWDSGVKYAYVNHQTFNQYIPMIGALSWKKYPKEIQDLIVSSWAERIDDMRQRARKRQNSAREAAIKNGVQVFDPSPADVADARKKLMATEADLIKTLRLNPELVKLIKAEMSK